MNNSYALDASGCLREHVTTKASLAAAALADVRRSVTGSNSVNKEERDTGRY